MAKGYQPRRMSTHKPINVFQQKRFVVCERELISAKNLSYYFLKTK